MANQQQLDLIRQGALIWNEWRKNNSTEEIDLSCLELRNEDHRNAILKGANLQGANLREANLRKANVWCTDLRDADLRGADLRGANFKTKNLEGANLEGAILYVANQQQLDLIRQGALIWNEWRKNNSTEEIDLSCLELRNEDHRNAILKGANLQGANLREANLRKANLYGSDLREADLREADLREANLRDSNFQSANLEGANLEGATLYVANQRQLDLIRQGALVWNEWRKNNPTEEIDLSGLELRNEDHRNAILQVENLEGANLEGVNLIRANLEGANLEGANLIRANLIRANLIRANLIRANLIRANLEGVNLEGANLRRANLWLADLRDTDLRNADLRGTDLRGADFRGSDFRGTNFPWEYLDEASPYEDKPRIFEDRSTLAKTAQLFEDNEIESGGPTRSAAHSVGSWGAADWGGLSAHSTPDYRRETKPVHPTPEASRPSLLLRYPYLECPLEVALHQPFSIFVQLRIQAPDEKSIKIRISATDGTPEVEAVLRDQGNEFRIENSNTKLMPIDGYEDSEVRFILTPLEIGEHQLRADFYQHGRRIGSIQRDFRVVETLPSPHKWSASTPIQVNEFELKALPTIPPPDLELYVQLDRHDHQTLYFTLHSPKEKVDYHHTKVGQTTLQGSPLAKMQAVYQQMNHLTGIAPKTSEEQILIERRIASLGNELWDELIPDSLKARILEFQVSNTVFAHHIR